MIRATGSYRGQALELDQPLDLKEGERVIVEVRLESTAEEEGLEWQAVGISRLEEEWLFPGDSIYDDWRSLYGVPAG